MAHGECNSILINQGVIAGFSDGISGSLSGRSGSREIRVRRNSVYACTENRVIVWGI